MRKTNKIIKMLLLKEEIFLNKIVYTNKNKLKMQQNMYVFLCLSPVKTCFWGNITFLFVFIKGK